MMEFIYGDGNADAVIMDMMIKLYFPRQSLAMLECICAHCISLDQFLYQDRKYLMNTIAPCML